MKRLALLLALAGCASAPPTCAAISDTSVGPCVPSSDGKSITCPRERLDAIVQCVYAERDAASKCAVDGGR